MNYTGIKQSGKDEMTSINSGSGVEKDSSTGTTSQECHESRIILDNSNEYGKLGYPFPLVLRLRVLQIVCGITGVVMGAVACIEERGTFNLGIGVPTGIATILAAACSIYCSRGFGGYRPRPYRDDLYGSGELEGRYLSFIRFLGPLIIAVPTILLWTTAFSLHIALLILAYRVLSVTRSHAEFSTFEENPSEDMNSTMDALAIIFLILSTLTLAALFVVLRIEWVYDPD